MYSSPLKPKKAPNARKKRVEHRGTLAVYTGQRVGRLGGAEAGGEPGHGLALRGGVDECERGGDTGTEAGRDKDGTAAGANGRHVWCPEGHVPLRVDRAGDVRQQDVGGGDVEVFVARHVGDEGVDIREYPEGRTREELALGGFETTGCTCSCRHGRATRDPSLPPR